MTKPNLILSASILGLASTALAQTPPAAPTAPPQPELPTDPTEIKTLSSYGFGYQTGLRFQQEMSQYGINAQDIDSEKFVAAFWDAYNGSDPAMTQEKIGGAMQALAQNIQKREQEIGAANLEKGNAFLAENAKKEGITVTESGLQYEVLEKGGDKQYEVPAEGAQDQGTRFMVSYKGTLIDGTEFDASEQPVPFTLGVVPGFQEALKSMKVGSSWKIYLPPNLAYGEQRQGADIAPNSTLIFELKLHEILPPQPRPALPQGLQGLVPHPGAAPGQ